MFSLESKCLVVLMTCCMLFGCQAAENRVSDMTPDELSGFMIAAAMAGSEGEVNFGANGEVGFGIKNEAYTRSPGTHFDFSFKMDPRNVTPEQMKQYIEAARLLREQKQDATEVAEPTADNPADTG